MHISLKWLPFPNAVWCMCMCVCVLGEGTWYQLQRMAAAACPATSAVAAASEYKDEAAVRAAVGAVAVSLGAIWISHPHADHHLGIVRERTAALN